MCTCIHTLCYAVAHVKFLLEKLCLKSVFIFFLTHLKLWKCKKLNLDSHWKVVPELPRTGSFYIHKKWNAKAWNLDCCWKVTKQPYCRIEFEVGGWPHVALKLWNKFLPRRVSKEKLTQNWILFQTCTFYAAQLLLTGCKSVKFEFLLKSCFAGANFAVYA